MKENLVEFLERDIEKLMSKMSKALNNDDIGTYKNLLRAIDEAQNMIDKYGWKTIYSEYRTGKDNHKEVAIWEQNKQEIRNYKKWEVKEDNMLKIETM